MVFMLSEKLVDIIKMFKKSETKENMKVATNTHINALCMITNYFA